VAEYIVMCPSRYVAITYCSLIGGTIVSIFFKGKKGYQTIPEAGPK
jgi:hypothetical protein